MGFGALLLGYYKDGELVYAGRVGTGFTDQSLRQLTRQLKELRTDKAPFDKPLPAAHRRGAMWAKPKLVCEVEFTEWTDEGLLRHPSFQGLREDKPPRQITREEAKAMPRTRNGAGTSNAPQFIRPRSRMRRRPPPPMAAPTRNRGGARPRE